MQILVKKATTVKYKHKHHKTSQTGSDLLALPLSRDKTLSKMPQLKCTSRLVKRFANHEERPRGRLNHFRLGLLCLQDTFFSENRGGYFGTNIHHCYPEFTLCLERLLNLLRLARLDLQDSWIHSENLVLLVGEHR